MKHSPGFLALVNDARGRVKEWDIAELQRQLEAKAAFILIDIREDNEWANGHIPGAQHLGRGILERDIEAAVPDKNARVALYCGGGYRSALAADSLQKMGYTQCVSVDGGWRGWNAAGLPIKKD